MSQKPDRQRFVLSDSSNDNRETTSAKKLKKLNKKRSVPEINIEDDISLDEQSSTDDENKSPKKTFHELRAPQKENLTDDGPCE